MVPVAQFVFFASPATCFLMTVSCGNVAATKNDLLGNGLLPPMVATINGVGILLERLI